MKIVGIIAEYNPFHNGHKYHIEEAKKRAGADAAIVIMSGDFVQRGTPAIMPKHLRAALALQNGADLILELPACYATGSAEFFATGAVSILNALGCVDSLCFGCETDDLSLLDKIAEIFVTEPENYKYGLQMALKQGASYPKAREQGILLELKDPKECFPVLSALQNPNNILAIEYLKALKKLNSNIKPIPVLRKGAGYHDAKINKRKAVDPDQMPAYVEEPLASATALRAILKRQPVTSWKDLIPDISYQLLTHLENQEFPVWEDDFSLLMKCQLMKETPESLSEYHDISPELAQRIMNHSLSFKDYASFIDLLATKNTTYSHVSRALIHMLLGIKKGEPLRADEYACYARVLAFKRDASWIMSMIKEKSSVPLITKLAQKDDLYKDGILNDTGIAMLEQDIFASNLYETVRSHKFGKTFTHELKKQIEIL